MRSQPIRALNKVVISLMLMLIIFAAFFSWRSWDEEKIEQTYDLLNLAALSSQTVDNYLYHIKMNMVYLGEQIISKSGDVNTEFAIKELRSFKDRHAAIVNVALVKNLKVILETNTYPQSPIRDLSINQSFSLTKFLETLDNTTSIDIGIPLMSIVYKDWVIPIRYVIRDQNNNVLYILVSHLSINLLEKFWKDAPFANKSVLAILRSDGFLLMRYPNVDQSAMQEFFSQPRTGAVVKYLRRHNFPETGYVEGQLSRGPNWYLTAFRKFPNFPMYFCVSMTMDEFYAKWWDKVKFSYTLSAFLIIGTFITYLIVSRYEIAKDVEQKRNEEERNELIRAQHIHKFESLSTMAEAIAHKFNNIIYAITGNLELARDSLDNPIEARQYLNECMRSSVRAVEVGTAMLSYLGKANMHIEANDAYQIINDTVAVVSPSLLKEIEIQTKPADEKITVNADGNQIKNLLSNLIMNSIEAIDGNKGSIILAAKKISASQLQKRRLYPVDYEMKFNEYVCFCVTDTGCGFERDTLDRLFDPFFSTKFTGRGLGLAVVLGIIRAHKGAISVRSKPGKGSTFKVYLPVRELEQD